MEACDPSGQREEEREEEAREERQRRRRQAERARRAAEQVACRPECHTQCTVSAVRLAASTHGVGCGSVHAPECGVGEDDGVYPRELG